MGTRRPEPRPDAPRIGTAYQAGLEAVMAIVIALGLGAFADSRLGTSPVLLLVGLGIGFGSFVLRLSRLSRRRGGESAGDRPAPEASEGEGDDQDR